MAGLNEQERYIKIDDFSTENRPGTFKMVQASKKFIENGCVGFLTIYGGYGNGKSMALRAITNACIDRGLDVRYATMVEVMANAREAFQSQQPGDSDFGRITALAKTHVLILDELDKARISDYALEIQNHLFDFRYRNSSIYGTVLAWNGSFETLDLPAVRSRLTEFPIVQNGDADMRPLLGG